MTRRLRIQLEGDNAEPGQIAASDVARAILGLERALARAEVLVAPRSRRRGATGRHTAVVERAARLRFISTAKGSFIATLSLPEGSVDDDALPLDLEQLSVSALSKLIDVLEDPSAGIDPQLARAVAQLGDELGIGERTSRMTIQELGPRGQQPLREVTIDADTRYRMQETGRRRRVSVGDSTVSGTLVEADFERWRARLRLPTKDAVDVSFSEEHADQIKEALRHPTTLTGQVRFEPSSGTIVSVVLRQLRPTEQLLLASGEDFYRHASFAELQDRQGVSGHVSLDEIFDEEATDEEADAYVTAATE